MASTLNFYYTVELKFELAVMSKLSLTMSIAYFLSIMAVNFTYKVKTFKPFYLLTGFMSAAMNLSLLMVTSKFYKQLDVHPLTMCYVLHFLGTFIQELNYLPVLNACCRLCPEELESTSYGVFTSISNFGFVLSSIFTAILLRLFGVSNKRYERVWLVIAVQALYQAGLFIWICRLEFPRPFLFTGSSIQIQKVKQLLTLKQVAKKDQILDVESRSPKDK